MDFIINIFLILAIELTGVFLRYIPFHKIISPKQRKQLITSYFAFFMFQFFTLLFVFLSFSLSPKIYKLIIILGGIGYFIINCILIPNKFFKQIFVFAIQGTYYVFLHSFIALLIGKHFSHLPMNLQFQIQSLGFLTLLTLSLYPIWRVLKNSFFSRIALEKDYYWRWVWLVPCLTLIGNIIITMDGQWISTWKQFFSRLFMIATVIASWKCINLDFEGLDDKFRIKSENELLNLQIKSISDRAYLIEEKEEELKILRHDMRHHMQMLSSFILENENDKALAMIKKLNAQLSPIGIAKFCQNQIINSAISIYADKAIASQTELEYEISLPKKLPFNENDIAILLANALENAVNASLSQIEEHRMIKIQSRYEQGQMMIRVENYFAGNILFDENGIPLSLKEGHGFGMKSILSVVKKYNGTALFTHENNTFTCGFMFFNSYTL